ncbi:MAG: GNAT family N-acetyltransferase [Methanomassiliicoccales archaeon]|nr:GNAT family N-acetyltransferase [Methanomassiliicoccales archaeon]
MPRDVLAAQALMANTWSHLLKMQTGMDIAYPVRPAVWYSARMAHEPGGCLCIEEDGRIVATGFCLSCGTVGWIGPMEVHPSYQGRGYGSELLLSLETYLASKGCKVVGLETMKDIARNVSFYAQGGYAEKNDMLYIEKDWLEGQDAGRPEEGQTDAKEVRRLAGTIFPGFDPSKEFLISEETKAGKTLSSEGAVALLLTDPISGSGKAYLRTLLSESYQRLNESLDLVQRAEREALWSGARSIFTIISTDSELLPYLLRGGYRPKGVDVRMMKGSFNTSHNCSIISWSG